MPDVDRKLAGLFLAVFPGLKKTGVEQATRDSVESWDSIATVSLSTLIEEEFGTHFDLGQVAEWTSYQQVRAALRERLGE